MKKIVTYIPLMLVTIVAIACLSFVETERAKLHCKDVIVSIANVSHAHFINEDDVYEMIELNKNQIVGSEIININIAEMEKKIEADSTVLSSEVYFTVDDVLHINVVERTPIVRVVAKDKTFYVDENGCSIPISHRGSSRVIVASGEFTTDNKKVLTDVRQLVDNIRNDEVLLPMIEQIYVTPNHNFILVSKVGPARIEFGDMENCERKFQYLKTFYRADKVREMWHMYKSVSLKYKNQIVCTKI